jgi:hypothetical protein
VRIVSRSVTSEHKVIGFNVHHVLNKLQSKIVHSQIRDVVNSQTILCGSLLLHHGASSGCGWRLQIWRVATNILISSCGQPLVGGPPA